MGEERKKEYLILNAKPVIAWSILPFLAAERFSPILVTVRRGEIEKVKALLEPFTGERAIWFIEGGATRQHSVHLALEALAAESPQFVLIHDGARPWVDEGLILRVLETTVKFGACVPVVEPADAVKEVGESGIILRHQERKAVRAAQTPQGFSFPGILEAHRQASRLGARCIDDAEVYSLAVGPVFSCPGDLRNRKITFRIDLDEEGSEVT